MPFGALETVPKPILLTESAKVGTMLVLKVAVTFLAASIVTEHAPVPVQAPVQPAKLEPVAADAVKFTTAPCKKLRLHVAPQSMPAGVLETVPEPEPILATVSKYFGIRLNFAVMFFAASIVRVQVKPVQSPAQPTKLEPATGVAVKVTLAF
jgi:hypothetical protein